MKRLLLDINEATEQAGGKLSDKEQAVRRSAYRALLEKAEVSCPPPVDDRPANKRRGRLKRSKSRNLLERLRDFEEDVLRYMTDTSVPFTNNPGERDIRMLKLQQKISGCFRSASGASDFCHIRGYLSTCRKQAW